MKARSISAVIFFIVFKNVLYCNADQKIIPNLNNFEDSIIQMPCITSKECANDIGLEVQKCIDNICKCETNKCQKIYLKTTPITTRIGQNCMQDSECHILKSYCNEDGTCECITTTVRSESGRKCLNVPLTIGAACEEHVQCLSLNALCIDKKCNCPSNMHVDKGICFKNVELGFPCVRDEECSKKNFSRCSTKSNVCECDKNYVQSKTTSECLLKSRNLFSTCAEDVQCSNSHGVGARCSNGFCVCRELFHYRANINKCVLDALLDETCSNHSDCHQPGNGASRLDCIIGVCKCKPAYFEYEGNCLLNVDSSKGCKSLSFRDFLPYILSYLLFYILI